MNISRSVFAVSCKHGLHSLRQRNTRYKNPQLVAQHCFVASFVRGFSFFTWHDQLDPQQKLCCGLKKCSVLIGLLARAQAHSLHVKLWVWRKTSNTAKICCSVDPHSTFRNKFLQPVRNDFVAQQVEHTLWKTGNIDQNLQRNSVANQVEGFFI